MDLPGTLTSIKISLQLSTTFLEYLNNVEETSKDYAPCAIETTAIHNLLLVLKSRLEEGKFNKPWFTAVQTLTAAEGPLNQFEQALRMLQDIQRCGNRVDKLGGDRKEEISSVLSRMHSFKALLQTTIQMNEMTPSEAIKHDQHRDTATHRSLLDWISPTDYPAQQFDLVARRQEGTGQWFLDAPEVVRWLNEAKATLFCSGIPGAGKTMIAAITINHLLELSAWDSQHGVAYVFCNYKLQHEQDSCNLLAAILKQLAQGQAMDPVERLYQRHAHHGTKASLDEICETLNQVLAHYHTTYIIVDALDECRVEDGTRSQFLAKLRNLQLGQDVRLMVTSRSIPDIEAAFREGSKLEVRASIEDVKRFVDSQVDRMPKFIQRESALQELIQERIVQASDGMFLLARLYIDSLLDKRTRKDVISALPKLSKQSDLFDSIYGDALIRIEGQLHWHGELAKAVISWIMFARRPLSAVELCCALAVRKGDTEIDPDYMYEIEDLVSVCAGLIKFDDTTGIVRFIHYTTEEYFSKMKHVWLLNAESAITKTCMVYLSLSDFETGICGSDEDFAERLRSCVFYEYAAQHWGHHARSASVTSDVVIGFLQNKVLLEASTQAMMVDKDITLSNYSQQFPRQVTGLHLSAYFGLDEAVRALLRSGYQPNCKDSNGQTPLWWSAKKDYEAVTKTLCTKDTVTLHLLTREGEKDLVKVLLKSGYNVNTTDFQRRTPLHNAIALGNTELVADFLSAGAEVDAKDMNGATPIRLAINLKKVDMVTLLLGRAANTMEITSFEWRRTFGNHISDILKLTEKQGGSSLQFISQERQNEEMQTMTRSETQRFLLQFEEGLASSRWPIDSREDPQPYDMNIFSTEIDDQQWVYSIIAYFPTAPTVRRSGRLEDSERITIRIRWNVIWDSNMDGTESWKSIEHFSTLPYIWVPLNGIDFLQHFIISLEQYWLLLCDKMYSNLSKSRAQVLRRKGSDPRQLDRLLEDGQMWINLRSKLQDQVEDSRRFAAEYCNRHNDIGALENFLQRIAIFSDNVSQKISQLDDTSKGLIQIEFSLVSINEARRSTSTSTSMKRLSWITFVFLPLIFISGLFGMNIDLLKHNPPWWLYFPFATATTIMTSVIWIVFKRNPNLEQSIEQKFGWLVSPQVVRDEEKDAARARHKRD